MILNCEQCQSKVKAELVARYDRQADESDYPDSVQLFKCPACTSPILLEVDDVVGEGTEFNTLYPAAVVAASASVPPPIREAFNEAVVCLHARAYTAAAIMCRKSLEAVCVAHNVQSRSLVEGLKRLRENGIIEGRLFNWADALRMQGNEAAHDVTVTTSAQDARDLVEFAHALLEYVFTFTEKFAAFQTRRNHAREKAKHDLLDVTHVVGKGT